MEEQNEFSKFLERESKEGWLSRDWMDKVKLYRFWVDAGILDSCISQGKWSLVSPDFPIGRDRASI